MVPQKPLNFGVDGVHGRMFSGPVLHFTGHRLGQLNDRHGVVAGPVVARDGEKFSVPAT